MGTSKTAMQQLIDAIDSVDVSNANLDMISTAHFIKMKAIELRDTVEKDQIQAAYYMKAEFIVQEEGMLKGFYKSERVSFDQYYNETYGNESINCKQCGVKVGSKNVLDCYGNCHKCTQAF